MGVAESPSPVSCLVFLTASSRPPEAGRASAEVISEPNPSNTGVTQEFQGI